MMTLKEIKKQSFTLSSDSIFFIYTLRVKALIFWNENSILDFGELAIFHSIEIRASLGPIVWKIRREKVWRMIYAFWYLPTYVTYAKI